MYEVALHSIATLLVYMHCTCIHALYLHTCTVLAYMYCTCIQCRDTLHEYIILLVPYLFLFSESLLQINDELNSCFTRHDRHMKNRQAVLNPSQSNSEAITSFSPLPEVPVSQETVNNFTHINSAHYRNFGIFTHYHIKSRNVHVITKLFI